MGIRLSDACQKTIGSFCRFCEHSGSFRSLSEPAQQASLRRSCQIGGAAKSKKQRVCDRHLAAGFHKKTSAWTALCRCGFNSLTAGFWKNAAGQIACCTYGNCHRQLLPDAWQQKKLTDHRQLFLHF